MKTFFTGAEHLGINDTDEARKVISSWNGKDETFYHEGTLYHEDDVSLLEELTKD